MSVYVSYETNRGLALLGNEDNSDESIVQPKFKVTLCLRKSSHQHRYPIPLPEADYAAYYLS